ncbi:MAG TPA: response regulator [Stellaceae bacterium]
MSRILVVEDDPDIAPLMHETLSRAGYAVAGAKTVSEARSLLQSGAYDLVLTDWKLPDGSGIMLAREAKARGIETLMITGYALSLPPAAFEGHDCLRKPLTADDLLSAIRRHIGSGQPAIPTETTGTHRG